MVELTTPGVTQGVAFSPQVSGSWAPRLPLLQARHPNVNTVHSLRLFPWNWGGSSDTTLTSTLTHLTAHIGCAHGESSSLPGDSLVSFSFFGSASKDRHVEACVEAACTDCGLLLGLLLHLGGHLGVEAAQQRGHIGRPAAHLLPALP